MSRSCFSRHLKAVLCILIACFLLTGTVECRAAHAENVEAVSDFDYAFEHDYVDQKWAQEDPNRQISSAEFKLMLTRMIESTVPDRLPWFNSKVSDDDMPASREVGTLMSWYAAVALGQDDYNTGFDVTVVFNDTYNEEDEVLNRMFSLLPEAWIQTTVTVPNCDQTWGLEHGAAVAWNVSHVSSRTGSQTIPFDEEKGTMHFAEPLTVFDAVSAVSRLWDSFSAGSQELNTTAPEENTPSVEEGTTLPGGGKAEKSRDPKQDIVIKRAQDMRKRQEDRKPEDLQSALEMGIISEALLARANDPATEREAAQMVQSAFVAGTGSKSSFLEAVIRDEEDPHLEEPACRFWMAILIGHSYNQWFWNLPCEGGWKKYLDENNNPGADMPLSIPSGMVGIYLENEYEKPNDRIGHFTSSEAVFTVCTDLGEWLNGGFQGAIPYHNSLNPFIPYLGTTLYDRTTGEKVLPDYGDGTWRPLQGMTIEEAALAALRYARSYEPGAILVSYEEAGTYDQSIIPDELLQKDTSLPYNDCTHLPTQWHGMMNGKLSHLCDFALGVDTDHTVYPFEIQIVKAAGLNFIRLGVSFSRLQGNHFLGEHNKVNLTRLRELDQVLAWCMEQDVHLQIVASDLPNNYMSWNTSDFFGFQDRMGRGLQTNEEILDFAAFWGMLSKRYAAIPNEYLSFNLLNEPYIETEDDYARMLTPSVEAIRKYSPDRTIIADIHNPGTITGEAMASLGVALSAHFYEPIGFIRTEPWQPGDFTEEHVTNVQWPGENEDIRHYFAGEETPWIVPYNTVKATAEKYGVGFMVGEFGILILDEVTGGYPSYRYNDEAIYGYYSDVLNAFREDGTPWCFGISNSPYGLFQLLPIYDTEYEQVGYYYVDTKMRDFLKSYQSGQ